MSNKRILFAFAVLAFLSTSGFAQTLDELRKSQAEVDKAKLEDEKQKLAAPGAAKPAAPGVVMGSAPAPAATATPAPARDELLAASAKAKASEAPIPVGLSGVGKDLHAEFAWQGRQYDLSMNGLRSIGSWEAVEITPERVVLRQVGKQGRSSIVKVFHRSVNYSVPENEAASSAVVRGARSDFNMPMQNRPLPPLDGLMR